MLEIKKTHFTLKKTNTKTFHLIETIAILKGKMKILIRILKTVEI